MPPIEDELTQIAKRVGVDPKLLFLLQQIESGGEVDPHSAQSSAGALGALQVMPDTGREMADRYGLNFDTPEGRTEAGARYYKEQLDKFGDPAVAAAAYHSGPSRVSQILESGGDLASDLGPEGRDYFAKFSGSTEEPVAESQYQLGDIETDPNTGKKYRLDAVNGQWEWTEVGGAGALEGSEISPSHPADTRERDIRETMPQPYTSMLSDEEAQFTMPFSLIDILEAVPGLGGLIGGAGGLALTKTPGGMAAGDMAGAAVGEGVRQAGREALGYVPATGMIQEAIDLDPESPEARVAQVGQEAGISALFNMFPFLGKTAEKMDKSARRDLVRALNNSLDVRHEDALVEKLGRLQEPGAPKWTTGTGHQRTGLPFPTSNRKVQRVADEMAQGAGADVEKFYGTADEMTGGIDPAVDALESQKVLPAGEKKAIIETPGYVKEEEFVDPTTGEAMTKEVNVPGTPRNPDRQKAVNKLINELKLRRTRREEASALGEADPYTRSEVWRAKQDLDNRAEKAAAKIFTPGGNAKKIAPKAESAADAAGALGDALAKAEPKGAAASARYNAARLLEEAAQGRPTSQSFVYRWGLSRTIPGTAGTLAGFAATFPRIWRGLSMKTKQAIATAIKAGDDETARALFRTATTSGEASTEETE